MSYPITTPYGQVAGYPLNNGFHNGIDYAYPMGTPVVVNGVTIGLSNNTGATTGPHLHVGKYVNGVVQNPGVGNGFSFNSAVVYDTGSDSLNGNFVRLTADGALWNYLNLQKVLVTKGQVLEGEDMGRIEELEALAEARQAQLRQIAAAVSVNYRDGNDVAQVLNNIKTEQNRIDELTKLVGQPDTDAEAKLEQIKKILG